MAKKSLNRTVVVNMLSTVIAQGLAFFTAPLFSRLLSPVSYGIVSVYTTWINVVSVLFTLEISSTLVMARSEYGDERQLEYQSSIMCLSLLAYAVFSFLTIAFAKPLSRLLRLPEPLLLWLLLHGFGFYCVKFINSKLTYEFQAEKNLLISIAVAVSSIVLSVALIPLFSEENNFWGRILGLGITYIVGGAVVFVYLLRQGRCVYNKDYWRFAIPLALPMVLHSLSNTILTQSDRLMLQWLSLDADVGIYSLAFSFAAVIGAIWTALNNSWVPFFFGFMREKAYTQIKEHASNYTELFSILTIGFLLLCPEVFHLYAPKEYWRGLTYVFILVMGHYVSLIYSYFVNYEFFYKKTKIIARGTLCAAVVNLVLNYVLLKTFGAIGVAIATLISVLFKAGFHYYNSKYVLKIGDLPFTLRALLPPMVTVFLVAAVMPYAQQYVILRWLAGVSLGVWELLRIKKRKAIF